MAARQALAGQRHRVPKLTDGIVEAIRQLRLARDSAVKARTAAFNQLTEMIVTAPDELRQHLASARPRAARRRCCAPPAPRPRPPARARAGRQARAALARPPRRRARPRDRRPRRAAHAARRHAPRRAPPQLLAVSTGHAGQLLVTAGQNIDRLRSDGAFAALCGASPIPVSSGRRDRHRLNHGGDRDANRTLHMIAVCRLRYCATHPRLRRTPHRRRQDQAARSSAASSATSPARPTTRSAPTSPTSARHTTATHAHAITITCGAGPIGRTRRRA